jgi:dienelactone hydrolase
LAEGTAIRKRRVRLFELMFTALLLATATVSAITWSDFSAAPQVSPQYVHFPSTDGVTIAGILFTPHSEPGPFPGVVVVHGLTNYKEEYNRISVELARRGFMVLAIDLRAHGMSDGTCTFGLPTAEPQDVAHAVDYLRLQPGVDPSRMAIVGHSFGGMVSLTAAAMPTMQVNATVTWAAPINLTSLARDNYETVAYVADKRVLPASILDPATRDRELALRSPIQFLGALRPNSTLFLHSEDDELIPVSQVREAGNATMAELQRVEIVEGAGHAMATEDVMQRTISFIENKTKGRTSAPMDPVYPSFTRDATWLSLALTMLAWPLAWLSWEFWCTRNPQLVKHYTYPADRSKTKALVFIAADLGAFAGVVVGVSALVVPGSAAAPFALTLPAPSLFAGLLFAGVLLCAAAVGLSRVEREVRGRDDKRFEEGENLARSVRVGIPVLLMIPLTGAFQYGLFLGADAPRSAAFWIPVFVLVLLMFGLEAFVRLRVQARMRRVMAEVFAKRPLAQSLISVFVGTVLFFLAVNWVVMFLFKGYADAPGDSALFTLAVGVVSSILYDRTKTIVPGALFAGAYVAWVLNAPFHF